MKIHFLLTLAVIAVLFVSPVAAQNATTTDTGMTESDVLDVVDAVGPSTASPQLVLRVDEWLSTHNSQLSESDRERVRDWVNQARANRTISSTPATTSTPTPAEPEPAPNASGWVESGASIRARASPTCRRRASLSTAERLQFGSTSKRSTVRAS